ncbi:MAG: B12-binding domain-containing radical SAM protein [Steroidobacteraceae bacterium]
MIEPTRFDHAVSTGPIAPRRTRLRILIVDLVAEGGRPSLFGRVMNANQASVMPQVIAVWCEELGHDVRYEVFTGAEDLLGAIAADVDVLFVSAFTYAALTAYSLSARARKVGAVTILGGPHARCYPEDASRYFDYVLGLTDKALVQRVLGERAPARDFGLMLSADRQPTSLPPLRQRWKFVEATLRKAVGLKIVPMIGSMGCPYTCAFCIDADIEYQPLPFEQVENDLKFAASQMSKPIIGWHDPNFGVRFDDYMSAIERASVVRPMRHIAETSLSLLSAPHLARMRAANFVGILPGIESWYEFGNKSKSKAVHGFDKMALIADHVNLILRHIPFVQTNFVLGLDTDSGEEPFALSRKFIDLVPGAYPAFSLFTAYGRAAPLNLALQRDGRVLPFPFPFLESTRAMNVRPLHYSWPQFYRHSLALIAYAWSGSRVWRRLRANRGFATRTLNFVRATTTHRMAYHGRVLKLLETDLKFRGYFEGDHRVLPDFYLSQIPERLGRLQDWLPAGAIDHDSLAYQKKEAARHAECDAPTALP